MTRFNDGWVVEKTMMEYVNGGGCSCCGGAHAMMEFAQFVEKCSDWESDDRRGEQSSVWPAFIHEEVLADRVKARSKMKARMPHYEEFYMSHHEQFQKWLQSLNNSTWTRIFQLPAQDVMEYFRNECGSRGSYEIVLCAVTEQLKNFQGTGYVDGRTEGELFLEKSLQYIKGAFILPRETLATADDWDKLLGLFKQLGGPKLLPIRTKDSEDPRVENQPESVGQSFRSDRRLMRLCILRQFMDLAIRKYSASCNTTT